MARSKHKHLLSEAVFITCPICNKKLQYIKPAHCRMHNLSFDELREKYPDTPTMTRTESEKRSSNRKASQNKIDQTYQKQGKKVGFADTTISKKAKDTMVNKYGAENIMKADNFAKNRTNPMKDPKVSQRAGKTLRKTIQERGGHWTKGKTYEEIMGDDKAKKLKEHKSEIALEKFDINVLLPYFNLKLVDSIYEGARYKHKWLCEKCGDTFKQEWNKIQQNRYPCPTCVPRISGESRGELEVYEFLIGLGLDVERHNKSLLNGSEIDMYIKIHNLAIEYNGLYWHNSEKKEKTYHKKKTDDCESMGIQLIHIFEDEWIFRKDIVESRLKYLLGLQTNIINARQCTIKKVSNEDKDNFLIKNHIQSRDIGSSVRLGAYYNNSLVAIMTFGPPSISKGDNNIDGQWEMKRFCSEINLIINGIAGKLLSHFKKNYPWKKIITFADRRWSTGKLYRILGFEEIRKTDPGYWYIKGLNRIHRYKLRKKFDEPKDVPERILRESEGYVQIYDSGHIRFELKNV